MATQAGNKSSPIAFPEADQPIQLQAKEFEEFKFLRSLQTDPERAYDVVRAFDFNGFFEDAYTEIDGNRVPLTVSSERGGEVLLELDQYRKIYASK